MRPKLKLAEPAPKERTFIKVKDSDLLLHTDSKRYYVRKTFKRYRIPDLFESTREVKIGKAKSTAARMIADHLAKYLGNNPSEALSRRKGRTVASVIDEILMTVTPTKRARTQRKHQDYFKELKRELGPWDVNQVTQTTWIDTVRRLRAKNKKRSSYWDLKKHLNILMRYAYNQKYTSHLLKFPDVDGKRAPVFRVYTDAEIQALWDHMGEDLRDQFVLCYECFMRLREALHLTWDRVNLIERTITLRDEDVKTGTATGKGRTFVMSDEAHARLTRRFKTKKSPYVFPSPRNKSKPVNENQEAWRRAKSLAEITGRARWHDLRHTALSKALLVQRIEVQLVSEYAGVSIATLQRTYLHSTANQTAIVAQAIKIQPGVKKV